MPSPWKVSPAPSLSASISALTGRPISGRVALGAGPPHELDDFGLRWQRRNAVHGERGFEAAALRVGEGACTRRAHGLRARLGIGQGRTFDQGIEYAQKVRLGAPVGVAITFDQPAAESDFQREFR